MQAQYKKAIFTILLTYIFFIVMSLLGSYLPFFAAKYVTQCQQLRRLGFILPVDMLFKSHFLQVGFLSSLLIILYLVVPHLPYQIPIIASSGIICVCLLWIISYFLELNIIPGCGIIITGQSAWIALVIFCFNTYFILLRLRHHVSLPRKKKKGPNRRTKIPFLSKIIEDLEASGFDEIISMVFYLCCVIMFFYFYLKGEVAAFVIIGFIPILRACQFLLRVKSLDLD